ncbi:helix-turn-helix domain-containing protein [Paenibacillus sp. SI8]|uniref:helix-turn-helix domain-containing protein n=1 Tax=unclassified Paenibacillus TaxID=185978 RepID=UPI0034662AD2
MAKKVVVKIADLTKQHKISLRELSRISDVRHAALSELSNGKRENMNFSHIVRIAEALDIDDIREIIDLVDVKDEELLVRNEDKKT